MAELGICFEREDLSGGRFRHTQAIKPIAYADAADAGRLKRIVADWVASGIPARPHIVTASRMMVSVGNDGLRRIHPTREADRYLEIGTPYVKVAGVWRAVGFTSATRTANNITWHRSQADLRITHGGHFIKLDLELLGGYVPEQNLVAFPVGLSGLTRSGARILAGTETVALLRAPVVTDAANRLDVRPIAYEFTNVGGQPHIVLTLPSLAGMTRPVVDPTLTLQPDAAAGKDTYINESLPTLNNGGATYLRMGYFNTPQLNRVLIQFDLSSISASATVTSATMRLYLPGWTYGVAHNVLCYAALRAWVEGTGIGTSGSGATWNTYDGSNNWGTAGCANTTTDRQAAAMATSLVPGDATTYIDWALATATVGQWVSGALTNNGMLMKTDAEATHAALADWYSSDYATAGYRPKLVVDYTAGCPKAMMHYARLRRL